MKVEGYSDFKYAIELAMREEGISQAEMARKIGVSRSTVCEWMSGKRKISVDYGLKMLKKCGKQITVI